MRKKVKVVESKVYFWVEKSKWCVLVTGVCSSWSLRMNEMHLPSPVTAAALIRLHHHKVHTLCCDSTHTLPSPHRPPQFQHMATQHCWPSALTPHHLPLTRLFRGSIPTLPPVSATKTESSSLVVKVVSKSFISSSEKSFSNVLSFN